MIRLSSMRALWQRLFAIAIALAAANCATNPVTGEQNFVTISEEEEIMIGRQEDPKVLQEYGGFYDDPALQRYVEEIGQRLVRVSHRPNLQYFFRVVDSPQINAFALPAGYIYVTRGILNYLNSEAELAAVLGHETGAPPDRARDHCEATGMTYATLARGSPIGKFAEQNLRLINGHYPRGEPVPGQALKIVE